MHFTLLVAGALLPGELAVALANSLNTPTLQARIARATVAERTVSLSVYTGGAHLDWLAQKLFGQSAPIGTAPYAYAHVAGKQPVTFVWFADPVHLEVTRDQLIVQQLGSDAPTAEESKQLIAAANELLLESGCELVVVAQCWFLSCMHDWQIDARPLQAAIADPVELPSGPDAETWTRLHNDIQIAWHAHPVNAARENNAVPTINGVWLHGGGRWKPLPRVAFAQVHADAPAWHGVAYAAGAHGLSLGALMSDRALVIFEAPWVSKQRQDWGLWLQAMSAVDRTLADHATDSIDLVLCGNTSRTFELRPTDRYKPWRRRALAEALTE